MYSFLVFSRQDKRFCIITGPNLGGKSTFLRSIALNVLMAQVGSFVASREATIFPCDRILVRIGEFLVDLCRFDCINIIGTYLNLIEFPFFQARETVSSKEYPRLWQKCLRL